MLASEGRRGFPANKQFSFYRQTGCIVNVKKMTAIVHHGETGEGGFWATCLEVPGANGQGEPVRNVSEILLRRFNSCWKPNAKKYSGLIPTRKRRNWCWHETPGLAGAPSGTRLSAGSRRRKPFSLVQSKDWAQGSDPSYNEIKKHLARSICRNLSVPTPAGD